MQISMLFAPAWPKVQILFRCIPQVVAWIWIWGVWGQGLCLKSFSGKAGCTALLEEGAALRSAITMRWGV